MIAPSSPPAIWRAYGTGVGHGVQAGTGLPTATVTVWLVAAPPPAVTDTQSQPLAVPKYAPCGVPPGLATAKALPLADQMVLRLLVTS